MERIVPMPPQPKNGPHGPWGRRAALAILDSVLSQELNKRKLRERFEEEFVKDPIRFYLKFAFPLMPKEQDLRLLSGVEATKLTPDQVVLQMDAVTQARLNAVNPNPPAREAETATAIASGKVHRVYSPEWEAQKGQGHPINGPKTNSTSNPQPRSRVVLDRIRF